NGASRIFDVEGTATTSVAIAGLTVTRGLADHNAPHGSLGGGIYHAGGRLSLTGVVLSGNRAVGDALTNPLGTVGQGLGGGVFNGAGLLEVNGSLLTANQAQGDSDSIGPGFAGAGLG